MIRRIGGEEEDPLAGMANLFDLGVVFALGFMVALLAYMGLPELLSRQDVTLVKNPGTPQMEIIRKRGHKITRYRVSAERIGGQGTRLGTAWRLRGGDVVYVPEAADPKKPREPKVGGGGAGGGSTRSDDADSSRRSP